MSNIHIKQEPPRQPKPYEQYRAGHGMPASFMWNVQTENRKQFYKNYDKAFGHKPDMFIGGRKRTTVKKCKRVKCKYGYYSERKRGGCVMYDDASKCEESV